MAREQTVTFLRLHDEDEFVVKINLSNRPVVGWVGVMNAGEFNPMKISGHADGPTSGLS